MTAQVQKRSKRPVNLNLLKFHFPITAVTSITHRITGVLLFLGFWLLLYLLHLGLQPDGAPRLREILGSHWGKALVLVLAACAIFHLIVGFKHLLLDLHIGESLAATRRLSWAIWLIAFLLTAFLAYRFWW